MFFRKNPTNLCGKSEVPLNNVMTLKKLLRPWLIKCTKAKELKLQETFVVDNEVSRFEKKIQDHEQTEFLLPCVQS